MGKPCDTCHGTGLVWADLYGLRLGAAFLAFMAAGCPARHNEDGSAWHQLVCPACDGQGRGAGGPAGGEGGR